LWHACVKIHIIVTIPAQITIPSLTVQSLIFPIIIEDGVSLRTSTLDLFARESLIKSSSKEMTVLDSVVLGVGKGRIWGYFSFQVARIH